MATHVRDVARLIDASLGAATRGAHVSGTSSSCARPACPTYGTYRDHGPLTDRIGRFGGPNGVRHGTEPCTCSTRLLLHCAASRPTSDSPLAGVEGEAGP